MDRIDGPMVKARKLVEEHIATYGFVPHPDKIKDAIAEAIAFAQLASVPHREEVAILRAQVELLREAHQLANEALRSAWSIAEREGATTNWAGHRAQLRASLDASHAAMACLNATPPQVPPTQIVNQ